MEWTWIFQYFAFLATAKFLLSIIALLIVKSIIGMYLLRMKMPPGPFPWPFLGNLPIFMRTSLPMHELCLNLQKKYRDPMTIFFAHTPFLILTKYDLTKETLSTSTFSNRLDSAVMDLVFEGKRNMSFGPYDNVQMLLRKIGSRSLRTLIDAETLSDRVESATKYTIECMSKEKPVTWPKAYMKNCIYNIILSFAFGKTYTMDNPEFISLLEASDRGNEAVGKIFVIDFLPFGKYLPRILRYFGPIQNAVLSIGSFMRYGRQQIEEHRKTFKMGIIRDLTDALITEQIQLASDNTGENVSDTDVTGIINDFYTAGTETSSITLTWVILFMTINPDIQKECYEEIHEVIGDREVRLSDRPNLKLIEACVLETLRLRSPVSMGIPRSPQQDTRIGDYFIPKGTVTLSSFHAMHTDPDYWQDPLSFNPRLHFMEETGQIRKPPSFMPFGCGKRACVGEQLGKNVLFLAVVNLLQKVKWTMVPDFQYTIEPDPALASFALQAQPYPVIMELRK